LDRNTLTGLILIVILMMAWFYFSMPTEEQLQRQRAEQQRQDSIAQLEKQRDTAAPDEREPTGETTTQLPDRDRQPTAKKEAKKVEMGIFDDTGVTDTSLVTVETPLYNVTFTNVGAGPAKMVLKDYKTWDKKPVQLMSDTSRSAYSIGFLSNDNYNVDTKNLLFRQVTDRNYIEVNEGETAELKYELNVGDGKRIVITYLFFADTYELDVNVEFENLAGEIADNNFDFGWDNRLKPTEKDRTTESTSMSSYVYAGGELERFKLEEPGTDRMVVNGNIQWVSSRTKFFSQIIKTPNTTDAATLIGNVSGDVENPDTRHQYSTYIRTDIPQNGSVDFELYVGPLSWNKIKKYESTAFDMVDVGWWWMRWFADPLVRYAIIPFLNFMGGITGNIGLAIILFAIAIKIVLFPLTKKSFESMAAMKELQPEMKKIQEKYKDDPQKQQKATMKLYKEAEVNPLGGCLPNLLQFPILITLWRFFQSSIEIRQESFLWASDLSAPDVILSLPFSIPFLGDHLAGFVLLMSATMVVQTQLTGSATGTPTGGPGGMNMKAFQYILPLILLFVFNNFAAGLSLYYLIYNAMSIGQQLLIKKNMDHDEIVSKGNKKKGRKK